MAYQHDRMAYYLLIYSAGHQLLLARWPNPVLCEQRNPVMVFVYHEVRGGGATVSRLSSSTLTGSECYSVRHRKPSLATSRSIERFTRRTDPIFVVGG